MTSLLARLALVLVLLAGLAAPAAAADMATVPHRHHHHARVSSLTGLPPHALPFPRSKREQSVWASDGCWDAAQDYCTWGEAKCLEHDAQGACLKYTDHCDRVAQRQCRTWGGPLVPDIFDF
jgi:hypothetical protein